MSHRHLRRVEALRPESAGQLHEFARRMLGLRVPTAPVVAGNSAPFDYLCWVYFEGRSQKTGDRIQKAEERAKTRTPGGAEGSREAAKTRSAADSPGSAAEGHALRIASGDCRDSGGGDASADCVVWASRGGGKTMLGAAATVLDLLFKPGIEVRILGGSLEQSSQMFRYLVRLLTQPGLRGVLRSEPTQRRVELLNGSVVEVLAQSQCSVRGTRVHKLRCDEVEEFDPAVWEAAQRVTRSGRLGGIEVVGSVEALSTMHRPFGLMARLTKGHLAISRSSDLAIEEGRLGTPDHPITTSPHHQIFRWCALGVVERCDEARRCEGCVLWNDCQGRARQADGFVSVNDIIAQWWRSSVEAWNSEMMCRQPQTSQCVYARFDAKEGGKHVGEMTNDEGRGESAKPRSAVGDPGESEAHASLRHSPPDAFDIRHCTWVGGMDFGMRSPLVMLWGRVVAEESDVKTRNAGERSAKPRSAVRDPRDPDLDSALRHSPPVAFDIRHSSMLEIVDEYVQAGLPLAEHLERIAQRGWGPVAWIGVDPAGKQRNSQTGRTDIAVLRRHGYKVRARPSRLHFGIERIRSRLDHGTLRIAPRCVKLIEALSTYHFDVQHPERQQPVKDGPDHLCDALRYLVVNLEAGGGKVKVGRY